MMIQNITPETPIALLTVGQLRQLFSEMQTLQPTTQVQTEPARTEKKYLYSIKELAELLNCSTVTAMKLKQSGKLPFRQIGRKCIFEVDAVLGAMHTNKGKGQKS
ncbi:MAG: DUF3853 family protein [Bacteroidia bacterium]|nr:DUF3853 family protein [Bacteroidia bacterium]